LLAVNLAWIQQPALFGLPSGDGLSDQDASLPARLAFVSVAVWWIVFAIPLFRRVPEPPRTLDQDEPGRGSVFATAFSRLGETMKQLIGFRQAFLMLLAFSSITTASRPSSRWRRHTAQKSESDSRR
jgi:UMF1 family MFS transporter